MSLFSPFLILSAITLCLKGPVHHQISVDGNNLILGPNLSSTGRVILYSLDQKGTFHRSIPSSDHHTGELIYSVLKNGILVAEDGPYAITYKVNKRGDLVPLPSNTCIYKTDKPAFYLEGLNKMLIPVEIFYSGDRIYYVHEGKRLLYSEHLDKSIKKAKLISIEPPQSVHLYQNGLIPDKACDGDIILFLLKSNGVFARNPPDEYIPHGMRLKYELQDSGALIPRSPKNGLSLTYLTTENGNLKPCHNNSHILTTLKETTKSFILGEGGVLAPVHEFMGINKTINYYFDGKLVHSSNQFRQVFSNSSLLVLSENNKDSKSTEVQSIEPGPKFVCPQRRIAKRDTRSLSHESKESDEAYKPRPIPQPRCSCAFDENGKRINLDLLVTECGNIALYKLTCKGHLKRMAPYKEPEHGFVIGFKLLPNFILAPARKCQSNQLYLKYKLIESGNLVPPKQENSFKKAPASMIYYVCGKNRHLFPVRLSILKNNAIELYYQDILIYTMSPESGKDLELFTTLYAPMYAYVNGRCVVGYSDPVPKSYTGSTWNNPNKSGEEQEYPSKNLYLIGPKGLKIKIVPFINKNGVPVVYEMDCGGFCHKSPKDDKKTMVLKSFKLLRQGILVPTNDTDGYIYLEDYHGNLLPYCYPESKLRAPFGLTVKYILCQEGIMLPCLVQTYYNDNYIKFSFDDITIYSKKTWTIEQILELKASTGSTWKEKELKADQDFQIFKDKNDNVAYYEKCGDTFIRHPSQKVESYLVHTIGYFLESPEGTLVQTQYPDPKCDYLQVRIEKNGNLNILSTSPKKAPEWKNYLMSKDGDLYRVDIKKKGSSIRFYRNGVRICKQKIENWELTKEEDRKPTSAAPTPSGEDPMGIFKDPPPPEKKDCKEPEHVPIPIKEIRLNGKLKCADREKSKCEQMKKTIKEIMAKQPSAMNIELQMSDQIMHEIYDMANKCSKLKERSRRSTCSRRRRIKISDDGC